MSDTSRFKYRSSVVLRGANYEKRTRRYAIPQSIKTESFIGIFVQTEAYDLVRAKGRQGD